GTAVRPAAAARARPQEVRRNARRRARPAAGAAVGRRQGQPRQAPGCGQRRGARRCRGRLAALGRAARPGRGSRRRARALRRPAVRASPLRAAAGQPSRRVRPYRRRTGDPAMKNVLIVAGREFRQILGMRSFWLTLLILPIAFGIGPLAQRFLDKHEPDRVMIIDRTGGGEARAIEQRFTIEHNRAVLGDLSRYVQRHHLEGADRSALWAQHDRWYSDADVARFVANGGVDAAQAKLKAAAPKGTPEFEADKPDYEVVAVPPSLAAVPDARLDEALKPVLKPSGKDAKPVNYVLLVPADFGASPLVRLWA